MAPSETDGRAERMAPRAKRLDAVRGPNEKMAPVEVERLESTLPAGDRWQAELAGIALRFGAGELAELGRAARELGASRVLLVADGGLRAARHIDRAEAALSGAGLELVTFDGVAPNPTAELVAEAAEFARRHDVDLIVGMGGGSAMDSAKGVNFLLTNGGEMEDYWGYDKAARPLLPSIGVPTTAGTGSDAQSFTLITQSGTGRKMACGAPGAAFRLVILDPELTLSAPRETAAAAGIDAVAHALESQVSSKRSAASSALSRAAWRRLEASFAASLDERADRARLLESRGSMLLAAHLAGAAIEASMLGAAHAAANPLTARHNVVHGVAVGLMLPPVIRFNAEVAGAHYRELWPAGAAALAGRVEELRRLAGLPGRIRECEVPRSSLPELAQLATDEWTGDHNPRPVGAREFLELYEAAY